MTETIVPDSEHRGLVAALPPRLRAYALLARFDRPIGWWLLFWPCAWGVLLAGGMPTLRVGQWALLGWLLLGAIAMRGAGCVVNDLWDRDIDRRVERTRGRPLASGAVTPRQAPLTRSRHASSGSLSWLLAAGAGKPPNKSLMAHSGKRQGFRRRARPARRRGRRRA